MRAVTMPDHVPQPRMVRPSGSNPSLTKWADYLVRDRREDELGLRETVQRYSVYNDFRLSAYC